MSKQRNHPRVKEAQRRLSVVLYGLWLLAVPGLTTGCAEPTPVTRQAHELSAEPNSTAESHEVVIRCRRRTLRGLRALTGEQSPDTMIFAAVGRHRSVGAAINES